MMPLKTIRMLFFPLSKTPTHEFYIKSDTKILLIFMCNNLTSYWCHWRCLKILSIKSSIHILSYSSSNFKIQCDITIRNPFLWNSINYSIYVSGLFYVNSLIYVICLIIVLFFCRQRSYIIYRLRPEVNFYIILAV